MSLSTRVKVTAYAVVAAYSLLFTLYGLTLPPIAEKVLALVPLALVAGFALFDNYLWRLGPILPLVKRPRLEGTWIGTLTSYRRDAADARLSSTHEAALAIRQSLTDISLTLMTAESKSRSAAAQILTKQKNDYVILYQYQNEPKMAFRDRGSIIHSGGSTIDVAGNCPQTLEGEYWTARDTRGTYSLRLASRKQAGSFAEAQGYSTKTDGSN